MSQARKKGSSTPLRYLSSMMMPTAIANHMILRMKLSKVIFFCSMLQKYKNK